MRVEDSLFLKTQEYVISPFCLNYSELLNKNSRTSTIPLHVTQAHTVSTLTLSLGATEVFAILTPRPLSCRGKSYRCTHKILGYVVTSNNMGILD